MNKKLLFILVACLFSAFSFAQSQKKNVVDEVIWVVGDSPILLSDVEEARISMEMSGEAIENPYAVIPEQLAIQKLFVHQAELDSVEVSEQAVMDYASGKIDEAIQTYGSRENVEAIFHKSIAQIREQQTEMARNQQMMMSVRSKLTENIKATPAEVRDYFNKLPEDSLPYINTQVEVEIITSVPKVAREEVERVEGQLREIAARINSGEKTFAQMAKIYSQDGSARNGGELGLSGRNQWVPEFANVAFSLTDPKKVSRIVRTEFGFHILQLIEKRGDKVNVRHIIIKPEIEESEYERCIGRLDSIATDIRDDKFTFEAAAQALSDDKDTRLNNGLMANTNPYTGLITSKFEMKDLPQDIAKIVSNMAVGEISPATRIMDEKTGGEIVTLVKLKSRTEGHRASVSEDFQVLKEVVENKRKEEAINKWLTNKIKSTYTRVSPDWRNYKFQYDGWIK